VIHGYKIDNEAGETQQHEGFDVAGTIRQI
jgi:hypothetical protein